MSYDIQPVCYSRWAFFSSTSPAERFRNLQLNFSVERKLYCAVIFRRDRFFLLIHAYAYTAYA